MTITKDELLAIARHERDALGRTVQYTPPERWEDDSPCEGWRVKDVLAHLAGNDVVAAALVAEEPPAELEEYRKSLGDQAFSRDGWNEWSVERRRDANPVSLGLEWGRAADLFLARASQAGGGDWDDREIDWMAGPLRLKYLVQVRVAEWWVHGEDIREGAALPPRVQHWPVYAVNDLAIRLLPYSLSQRGESFPGKTV
ncbi:MAG TPA: maleylpyruvate isomerase family mycothiol-dependent enzyme, partial [Actinomycetota bacterium]|nr:maleylpyruvate isomerase family mycothiol-dependent enzyme [Actinomycetota bacterium]